MQQEQPEKVAELLIQFLQKQSPKLDQKLARIGMDFGRGTASVQGSVERLIPNARVSRSPSDAGPEARTLE
jgi:hypothetical protein